MSDEMRKKVERDDAILLRAADEAQKNGDMARARQLRRLIGD